MLVAWEALAAPAAAWAEPAAATHARAPKAAAKVHDEKGGRRGDEDN